MSDDQPKVLFYGEVRRGRYLRNLIWSLLTFFATVGTYYALNVVTREAESRPDVAVLDAGMLAAAVLGIIAAVRALVALARYVGVPTETVKVVRKGIVWTRRDETSRYKWANLRRYRRGARTLSLFGRPLLHYGTHDVTMKDGRVLSVGGRHGDPHVFDRVVQPIVAEMTGTRISRALREGRSIKLGKTLRITPDGVQAGRKLLGWREVDVLVRGNMLLVRRVKENGKFKTVKRYALHNLHNVAGFLDVAESVIQNYQPARFNIKTKGQAAAG